MIPPISGQSRLRGDKFFRKQQIPASDGANLLRVRGKAMRDEDVVHIVDDDEPLRRALYRLLRSAGNNAISYGTAASVIGISQALQRQDLTRRDEPPP
jgi:hypothetical protein